MLAERDAKLFDHFCLSRSELRLVSEIVRLPRIRFEVVQFQAWAVQERTLFAITETTLQINVTNDKGAIRQTG